MRRFLLQTNIGTVDAHVADYQRMIDNLQVVTALVAYSVFLSGHHFFSHVVLQVEVSQLRRELADKDTQLSARTPDKTVDDELSWLDVLSNDINENVEERINLQKAVFELEDMNARNKAELQLLDEQIVGKEVLHLISVAKLSGIELKHFLVLTQAGREGRGVERNVAILLSRQNIDKEEIESLVERRQVILDNIRDNDEAGAHYRQVGFCNLAHNFWIPFSILSLFISAELLHDTALWFLLGLGHRG